MEYTVKASTAVHKTGLSGGGESRFPLKCLDF